MLLFYWKEKKKSCCTRRWGSYTLMKRETEAELKDAHPSWSMRSMLKEGCASWSSAEVSLFFSVCCSTWGAAYFLLRFSVKQYFFNCSFLLLVNKYKKIYHPCEQGSKKFSSKIMNNTSNRESAESWKISILYCAPLLHNIVFSLFWLHTCISDLFYAVRV